jgi:hypothetical protein
MVAVYGGVGTDAGAEAELGVRDEACPLMILNAKSEGVAVDKSAN